MVGRQSPVLSCLQMSGERQVYAAIPKPRRRAGPTQSRLQIVLMSLRVAAPLRG